MRHFFLMLAAGAAALTIGPAANASAILKLTPPDASGVISGTFEDDGIGFGDFDDAFDFVLAKGGQITGTISSSQTGPSSDIDFMSVLLNGQEFRVISTGAFEFRLLDPITLAAGPQHLTVRGHSAGNGSYAGTLSFAASPVSAAPEPAAWALMIMGFGGAGALLRRRREIGRERAAA